MSRKNPARLILMITCLSGLLSCSGNQELPEDTMQSQTGMNEFSASANAPALQGQLEHALDTALLDAGRTRETKAAPTGLGSRVPDLTIRQISPFQLEANWTYRNQGDYDLNTEVNVADLTPLGQSFNKDSQSPNWINEQWADGDGNGLNNLADVTPIGQNFGGSVNGYHLESSINGSDSWQYEAAIAHNPGHDRHKVLTFPHPAATKFYRVVPYMLDGSTSIQGEPSNVTTFGFNFGGGMSMLGGNAQHSGVATASGPDLLNIYDEVALEGQIFASNPVADENGNVYICTTFPGEGYGYIYGVS